MRISITHNSPIYVIITKETKMKAEIVEFENGNFGVRKPVNEPINNEEYWYLGVTSDSWWFDKASIIANAQFPNLRKAKKAFNHLDIRVKRVVK